MTLDHAALLQVLEAMKAAEVDDRIRLAAQTIYQALIDAELTHVIGAGPWEHTPTRTAQRNGSRPRLLSTPAGDLGAGDPEAADRVVLSFAAGTPPAGRPSLFAVVMEAYLHGVSTRKVDDVVKALGIDSGISKSEVSRICADLDVEVAAFRDRSLAGTRYPYMFVDAAYCNARINHRVVAQTVVIATGVTADAAARSRLRCRRLRRRCILDGVSAVAASSRLGWVQLVISDAHEGLKQAIRAVMLGAAWQRCRVHFLRNVLAQVPRGNAEMVAAAIRIIFAQPDAAHVHEQFETIATMLGRQLPKVEQMMRAATEDLLAFAGFPVSHWKKDLVDQPAGAAQPRGETPHRRRRCLPKPARAAQTCRRCLGRNARRMGHQQRNAAIYPRPP